MSIKPKLTLFDTTMIVVSLVIGIGIFRTPAMVASSAGTPAVFFTAWILGGIISFMGALTFAEVGARFTNPGAYYMVVADCYKPAIAFMLNWTNVVIVNCVGAAAVAMIGAEYIDPVILPPALQTPLAVQLTAAGMTIVLLVINYLGIKTGAWAQNVLTVIKIGMIMMLAYVAFRYGGGDLPSGSPPPVLQPPNAFWVGLGLGLISVFYTYGGYQNTLNFGGDIQSAKKIMPRAIFLGIVIIVFLYTLINVAYFRVLGIQGIAGAKLVAAEVALRCFGQSAYFIVSVAIFFSSLGFLNVTLLQIPRTYFAMAETGSLPRIFMKVNEKTQVQEFTLLFYVGMILVAILFLGTFEILLSYVMFFDCMNNALVASTIFVLRRRSAAAGAPYEGYTMPLYPVLPLLFIAVLLSITVNVFITESGSIIPGFILFAAGYPMYRLLRYFSTKGGSP